jgi:hypothetical protein
MRPAASGSGQSADGESCESKGADTVDATGRDVMEASDTHENNASCKHGQKRGISNDDEPGDKRQRKAEQEDGTGSADSRSNLGHAAMPSNATSETKAAEDKNAQTQETGSGTQEHGGRTASFPVQRVGSGPEVRLQLDEVSGFVPV